MVSVQTQSITALSSVRKGTKRNLENHTRWYIYISLNIYIYINQLITILPLEEKEVYVVVVLCKEVAQDAIRVTTFDLVGRQAEVDTLHKIPELSDRIPVESPAEREGRTIHKEQN